MIYYYYIYKHLGMFSQNHEDRIEMELQINIFLKEISIFYVYFITFYTFFYYE